MKILRTGMILTLGVLLASCGKEDPNEQNNRSFEDRLRGEWQLEGVFYSGEVPNPFDPGEVFLIEGDGKNVEGDFDFRSDGTFDFSYSFEAEGPLGDVPVSEEGTGEWWYEKDDHRVHLSWQGEEAAYDILTNGEDKQVWEGQMPVIIPGTGQSIPFDVRFTMVR